MVKFLLVILGPNKVTFSGSCDTQSLKSSALFRVEFHRSMSFLGRAKAGGGGVGIRWYVSPVHRYLASS